MIPQTFEVGDLVRWHHSVHPFDESIGVIINKTKWWDGFWVYIVYWVHPKELKETPHTFLRNWKENFEDFIYLQPL